MNFQKERTIFALIAESGFTVLTVIEENAKREIRRRKNSHELYALRNCEGFNKSSVGCV